MAANSQCGIRHCRANCVDLYQWLPVFALLWPHACTDCLVGAQLRPITSQSGAFGALVLPQTEENLHAQRQTGGAVDQLSSGRDHQIDTSQSRVNLDHVAAPDLSKAAAVLRNKRSCLNPTLLRRARPRPRFVEKDWHQFSGAPVVGLELH